jgi:hypothetical protein
VWSVTSPIDRQGE